MFRPVDICELGLLDACEPWLCSYAAMRLLLGLLLRLLLLLQLGGCWGLQPEWMHSLNEEPEWIA